MKCAACHPNSDPGKDMGLPATAACLTCHKTVDRDDPAIRKLALSVHKKHAVQWTRVYTLPAFVRFNHRTHLAAGTQCEDCHGPVATRDELFVEYPMTQKGCLDCHIALHIGGNNCFFWHN
jgi:hypothetical protein